MHGIVIPILTKIQVTVFWLDIITKTLFLAFLQIVFFRLTVFWIFTAEIIRLARTLCMTGNCKHEQITKQPAVTKRQNAIYLTVCNVSFSDLCVNY